MALCSVRTIDPSARLALCRRILCHDEAALRSLASLYRCAGYDLLAHAILTQPIGYAIMHAALLVRAARDLRDLTTARL